MKANSTSFQNFNAWTNSSYMYLDSSLNSMKPDPVLKARCCDRIRRINEISPHHFVIYDDGYYGYTPTDRHVTWKMLRKPKNPNSLPKALLKLEELIKEDNKVIKKMTNFEENVASQLITRFNSKGEAIGWSGNKQVLFDKIIKTYGNNVTPSIRHQILLLITSIGYKLDDKEKLLTYCETINGEVKFILGADPCKPEFVVSTNKFTLLPHEGERFLPQDLICCLEKIKQHLSKNNKVNPKHTPVNE